VFFFKRLHLEASQMILPRYEWINPGGLVRQPGRLYKFGNKRKVDIMNIHNLLSGATVLITSPGHGFKFSDGTSCPGQDPELCGKLTLKREIRKVASIKGMDVNQVAMILSEEQIALLKDLANQADLVMIPFPVLTALREQGVRDQVQNCVAMNATLDTQRSAPSDKIVDINNWSY